jgi:4-amino-4-deoxy-L-arabinose transferase-like glycosyltransferase
MSPAAIRAAEAPARGAATTTDEWRRRAGRAALVALFAAGLVFLPLGERQIVTGDEARFAVLAQDMLRRGTWTDARVREQRYRNKPLLYPWAIKVLSLRGGRVTETTTQLPIAVAAVAAVFFVTLLGQQLFSARAGVWAGLITSTSYAFFSHSQLALPDMLVVACAFAALAAFWASITRPPGQGALVAFYLAVALGVFAKGPMGLLPLLVVIVWLLTEHGVRGLRRLVSPVGVAAFLLLSAAWVLPFLLAGSRSFARTVVWEDWFNWYLGGPQPLNVVTLLLDGAQGFVPWTTVLLLPLVAVRREWRNGPFRFALLAWLIPLVAVSLSQNHRVRYLLPTYPAAALLVAWWADGATVDRARTVAIVITLSAVGAAGALIVMVLPWLDAAERLLVPGFCWKAALVGGGGAALATYACWTLARGRRALLVNGLVLGMAVLLSSGMAIYNDWVNRAQDYRQLAVLLDRHAQGGEIGVHGGRFFSIDFYLGRGLTPVRTVPAVETWLARRDRPLVVTPGRAWDWMKPQLQSEVEVVDTMRVRSHVMYLLRRSDRDAAGRPPARQP